MSGPLFDASIPARSRLVELIQLQAATIVSRALVHQPGGKLVLFGMGAGQEISEHRSPFTAIVHVLDGEITVTVDGAAHELRPGDWLLMPANLPHALRATSDVRFLLTMLRAEAPSQSA